ncbi:hypothetical protein AB4Y45_26420 [Paraburkholderia sp. EG287A]|uniref:hypothetical protein n=1 Tax=Paraburkholderia sp. EG287A TaxID=3237012 RepID=UPI0034D3740D
MTTIETFDNADSRLITRIAGNPPASRENYCDWRPVFSFIIRGLSSGLHDKKNEEFVE